MIIARQLEPVPLGIYECPLPEHRLLDAGQVEHLAATGRFVFMKETSRDREQHRAKLAAAMGSKLSVYQANLGQLPASLEDGAPGFCGIVANVFPELIDALCNDATQSPIVRRELHAALSNVFRVMVARHYPASMKYLLSLRGLPIRTDCRMGDRVSLDDDDWAHLDAAFDRLVQAVAALGLQGRLPARENGLVHSSR